MPQVVVSQPIYQNASRVRVSIIRKISKSDFGEVRQYRFRWISKLHTLSMLIGVSVGMYINAGTLRIGGLDLYSFNRYSEVLQCANFSTMTLQHLRVSIDRDNY